MLLSISLHFLVIVLISLLAVVLLLIFAVLLYGLLQYRKQVSIESLSAEIDAVIAGAIVNGGEVPGRINNSGIAQRPAYRRLMLEKLISAEKKFSGGAGLIIRSLFNENGLEKESLSKLGQKRTHLIAGGILELTAMRVGKALPAISRLLHHPSPQVYQEAQYSVVTFNGFEGLNFLNDAQGILSEWQQLRLLNSIPEVPPDSEGMLREWLQSANPSVTVFVLRIISKYQLLNMYADVLALFSHPNIQIRLQAVETLQTLENAETLSDYISSYETQPDEVKVEIINSICKMSDIRAADFFRQKLLGNDSVAARIGAAKGLHGLNLSGELQSLASKSCSPSELVSIIKHVLQEKI